MKKFYMYAMLSSFMVFFISTSALNAQGGRVDEAGAQLSTNQTLVNDALGVLTPVAFTDITPILSKDFAISNDGTIVTYVGKKTATFRASVQSRHTSSLAPLYPAGDNIQTVIGLTRAATGKETLLPLTAGETVFGTPASGGVPNAFLNHNRTSSLTLYPGDSFIHYVSGTPGTSIRAAAITGSNRLAPSLHTTLEPVEVRKKNRHRNRHHCCD